MLDTNVNKISQEVKYHVDFKTETKEDYIRETIEDNAIKRISLQNKALKGHA